MFLPVRLSDPMSGFFMMPRPLFEQLAGNLTGQGFKILLDLALSSPAPLRVIEIPFVFHERVAGKSKLDALVLTQFVGLLLDKVFGGLLPLRFISFALVGALGILVNLVVLSAVLKIGGLGFGSAQTIGTFTAVIFNFVLNNEITYRDQRLRGPRLWRGLFVFMLVCGVGAAANIGIATTLYDTHTNWTLAGTIGAMIGVVWNYAVSATLVWRAR
jgi:dolichol-phosphate mannosyltransferase